MKLITEAELQEIYGSGKYADPHAELAARLKVTRNEAKWVAHGYLYNQKPLKGKTS